MSSTNGYQYVDFTYLNNLVMGDMEFKKKIIRMFIDKTPAVIISMKELFSQEDWPSLKASAHKFKSSIDFVGSKELAQLAINLEINCENENKGLIEKGVQEVDQLCNKIYKELETELAKL